MEREEYSMTIENLGVKLYSGTKVDRKSDSLGSSADGANTGITLVPEEANPVITTDGSDTVVKFIRNGTFTPAGSFNVEYLVQAGGGSSCDFGGGGGAGGYLAGTGHGVTAQTYNITVGDGGALGGTTGTSGTAQGGNSVFSSFTAQGGGSSGTSGGTGIAGGSGSGGGEWSAGSYSGGAGVSGQGNDGGSGGSGSRTGGGGGGSASAGGNGSSTTGGNAGAGTNNDILISGSNVMYGSGGAGGGWGKTAGTQSSGGGAAQSSNSDGGMNGVDYTGGGAGGSTLAGTTAKGKGGKGVVILRFPTSGNSYSTTDTANPAKLGTGAYSLDGNDYVEVNGLKTIFNGATKLSIAGWIYPRDNVDETLLGQWNGSGNSDKVMDLHINGSNKLELSLRDGSTNYITTSSTSINENEWQHVAMTYDGATTTVKLYINGTLDVEDTSNPSSLHTGTGSPALFGIYGDKSSNGFDGNLDDWGCWSRVITATEISTLCGLTGSLDSDDFDNVYGSTQFARGFKVATSSSALKDKKVKAVTFYVKKNGSATGTAYAKIYNGTTVVETNTTGTNLDVSTLSTSDYTAHKFEFTGNTTLDTGYSVVYYFDGGTGSAYTQIRRQGSDVYDGVNTIYRKYHSSAWADDSGTDAKFILEFADPQLVSSLTNKSELKAYYSMDSAGGTEYGGGSFDDVAHWESSMNSWTDKRQVIGQKITSGNSLIGKTITSLGFQLYRGAGSTTDTITFGVWDSSSTSYTPKYTFGSMDISDLVTSGSLGSSSPCEFYTIGGSYTVAENDVIGVLHNIESGSYSTPNSVELGQGASYSNGSRLILKNNSNNLGWVSGSTDVWFSTTNICVNDFSSTSALDGVTGVRTNSIFQQSAENGATPSYWWFNGTSWVLDGTTETDLTSSSQTYTQVGTTVVKTTDTITATATSASSAGDGTQRVYTTLPSTLSNTEHTTDFDLKITANASAGDPDVTPIMYTAGTDPFHTGNSQDGYGFDMYSDSGNGNNYVVRLIAKDGTDNDYSSGIVLTPQTQYYCRLVRNSATLGTLNVYTNSARTTHTSGSPQTLTIVSGSDRGKDCTHLQSGAWSQSGSTSYIVSNVKLQNGRSTWLE
jgi:hypothetical protein